MILIGGSRSLASDFSDLISAVVAAVLAAGSSISVGCADGADAFAVAAALRLAAGSHLRLFCFGDSDGSGFWSGSAPFPLLAAAARSGASVSWLAGGGPAVPFRARLLRRSLAALAVSDAAVFFLASPSSAGSLRVAAAAAARELPVFAFACGFSGPPFSLSGCAGSWQPGSFSGSDCWAWRPAASQPSLL